MSTQSEVQARKAWVAFIQLLPLFAICVLPVTFLSLGILSPLWHYPVLAFMFFAFSFYCMLRIYIIPKREFTWKSLLVLLRKWGIHRSSTLAQSFKWNMIFTPIAALVLFAGSEWLDWFGKTNDPAADRPLFFVFYNFISVPVQTIFLFGIVIAELKHRLPTWKGKDVLIVILTACNFSYLHVFWMSMQTDVITLVGGLFWAAIYLKYPNIWPGLISHVILGSLAIMLEII